MELSILILIYEVHAGLNSQYRLILIGGSVVAAPPKLAPTIPAATGTRGQTASFSHWRTTVEPCAPAPFSIRAIRAIRGPSDTTGWPGSQSQMPLCAFLRQILFGCGPCRTGSLPFLSIPGFRAALRSFRRKTVQPPAWRTGGRL